MENEANLICAYNAEGRKQLAIHMLKDVRINEERTYIQGFCINRSRVLTLKVKNIKGIFETVKEAEAFLVSNRDEYPYTLPTFPKSRRKKDYVFTVCFTGFKAAEKAELNEYAEKNKLLVRQNVTQDLNILCCGSNAGPKKLQTALAQGAIVLTRPQLESLVDTGEISESV